MTDFTPQLHPQHEAILRGEITPPKTGEDAVTFNDRLGLWVTRHVGTMWCAYLFALIALISLPTVLKQAGFPIGFDFGGGTVILIAWIAQTFLQLVLLSVIMVGQDVQSKAADKRAEMTYKDAEAVLQEAREIQRHLATQDTQLMALVARSLLAGPQRSQRDPHTAAPMARHGLGRRRGAVSQERGTAPRSTRFRITTSTTRRARFRSGDTITSGRDCDYRYSEPPTVYAPANSEASPQGRMRQSECRLTALRHRS